MNNIKLPLIAAFLAIVITSTMDFTGFTVFSALPLTILIIFFFLIQRQTKSELGLQFGELKYYGIALLYPVIVLGLLAGLAYLFGDFSIHETDWSKIIFNILIGSTIGTFMIAITEEGFFRGWLWGSFRISGLSNKNTLIATAILFTLWHISAVSADTDYGLPLRQIPVYLFNASLLGFIWGLLRLVSQSVIVPSFCHAIWNSFAYELFGFGENVGALGIKNTIIFGPEVGFLGIALNGAFFLWLLNKTKKQRNLQTEETIKK